MSAVPQDARPPQRGRNQRLLNEALQTEATAQHQVRLREQRLRRAIDESAEELVYRCQTSDEREAEFQVYFHRGDEVDFLAAKLLKIDYRKPTVQERARYEDEFEMEISAAGDLWRNVASYIVG